MHILGTSSCTAIELLLCHSLQLRVILLNSETTVRRLNGIRPVNGTNGQTALWPQTGNMIFIRLQTLCCAIPVLLHDGLF